MFKQIELTAYICELNDQKNTNFLNNEEAEKIIEKIIEDSFAEINETFILNDKLPLLRLKIEFSGME